VHFIEIIRYSTFTVLFYVALQILSAENCNTIGAEPEPDARDKACLVSTTV